MRTMKVRRAWRCDLCLAPIEAGTECNVEEATEYRSSDFKARTLIVERTRLCLDSAACKRRRNKA